MAQMELQLPELTVEDFQRAWTRFELVSAAKEWNAEKQLTILPTLLRGKLIDFYTEFDGDTKSSLSTLKKALQEKAGLLDNPLVASKSFNQRDQLSTEEVSEYAGVLKRLFKQAYPAEGMDSTVLLQRFLTGVRPSIARQMLLLGKKPANLAEAIKDATAVEFALRFDQDKAEQLASAESVNVLRSGNNNKPIPKPVAQHDDVAKLQKNGGDFNKTNGITTSNSPETTAYSSVEKSTRTS